MYPNYSEDHKALGYEAFIDSSCGKQLVLITDSTILFVKNVSLNGKRKIFVIIEVIIIILSEAASAQAIGTNPFPQQMMVNITDQDLSRLIKLSIHLDMEPKIIMPRSVRIRTKSD